MKSISKLTKFVAAAAFGLLSFVATAAEAPYDKAVFDKLLADGKPVVVDFYADWCPTCKKQRVSVAALAADPKFASVSILIADYDKETELKKALRVSAQSTFVVFKGGKEVARSTGQTAREDVTATFAKAL